MRAKIQHRDALRLLKLLQQRGTTLPLLTYQTAAEALGREKKDARAVAQMCDLLDAAAALAGGPCLALVMVRAKGGNINPKAWRGNTPRDAVINHSLAHRFTSSDYAGIRKALRALSGLGNHAAWIEVRRRLGRELYRRVTGQESPDTPQRPEESLPNELDLNEPIFEGAKNTITVNAYERSREARRRCIDHWGCVCAVCRFDFARKYGPIGEGFIHVHHLRPLSEIGAEYRLDAIADLRPVCPNCHAMLHAGDRVMRIDQLRKRITAQVRSSI